MIRNFDGIASQLVVVIGLIQLAPYSRQLTQERADVCVDFFEAFRSRAGSCLFSLDACHGLDKVMAEFFFGRVQGFFGVGSWWITATFLLVERFLRKTVGEQALDQAIRAGLLGQGLLENLGLAFVLNESELERFGLRRELFLLRQENIQFLVEVFDVGALPSLGSM